MSHSLEKLTAAVERAETVGDSAITLINGLATELRAIKDDPAAIAALADRLEAQSSEISEALVANTPSQDEPTE